MKLNYCTLSVLCFSVFLLTGCTETTLDTNPPIIKPVESENTSESGSPAEVKEFEQYTPAALSVALDSGYPTVVFVSANWCPACVRQLKDMEAQSGKIPPNYNFLVADYDTHTEFKKEYKVTNKHTAVAFNSEGVYFETKPNASFEDILDLFDR